MEGCQGPSGGVVAVMRQDWPLSGHQMVRGNNLKPFGLLLVATIILLVVRDQSELDRLLRFLKQFTLTMRRWLRGVCIMSVAQTAHASAVWID